jgi:hypothetical protein
LCWDNARFVNHSSKSNCLTTAYEFEIAIRDIYPGEELTDDYGYLNIEEPFEVLPEEGTDRNIVYPDDLLRYYKVWDEQLLGAFPQLLNVPQPLFQILAPSLQEKVKGVVDGIQPFDSILHCYYPSHEGKLNGEAKLVQYRSPKIKYPF